MLLWRHTNNMVKRIILENPGAMLTLTNEELVQFYWETDEDEKNLAIEEEQIKAQKSEVKKELIARVKKSGRDGLTIGETNIKPYIKVYTNKVTLEVARELGATKTEEKVDSAKIGNLVKNGVKVEGAEEREEVRVTKPESKDTEVTA